MAHEEHQRLLTRLELTIPDWDLWRTAEDSELLREHETWQEWRCQRTGILFYYDEKTDYRSLLPSSERLKVMGNWECVEPPSAWAQLKTFGCPPYAPHMRSGTCETSTRC